MDKNFGFGCMRLPITNKDDLTSFDYEAIFQLTDRFLENGFTYFDTAYPYHSYKCESAVKEFLVKRYSRDAFQLTTKLPMRDLKTAEDMERIFNEQLENCGVDYFDYYMLHNIGVNTYRIAQEMNSFDFCLKKKAEGKIKKFGMSFHDTPELLDEILTDHPELEFVQLQINYIDWENPGIQAKRCHKIARKHNKPIIVMEPCKGGTLAIIPEKAERLMKEYNPNASAASWAIRFAASQEGVFMVLSGMTTMDQLEDNLSYMSDFKPLNDEEYEIIRKVIDIINENTAIACTNCRYCEKGCPKGIAIPDYFALYNSVKRNTSKNFSSQFVYYVNLAANRGRARDCIGCKQCEEACPQHLPIIESLKSVSDLFDGEPIYPSNR